jgi:hypothetical protein
MKKIISGLIIVVGLFADTNTYFQKFGSSSLFVKFNHAPSQYLINDILLQLHKDCRKVKVFDYKIKNEGYLEIILTKPVGETGCRVIDKAQLLSIE